MELLFETGIFGYISSSDINRYDTIYTYFVSLFVDTCNNCAGIFKYFCKILTLNKGRRVLALIFWILYPFYFVTTEHQNRTNKSSLLSSTNWIYNRNTNHWLLHLGAA